LESEEESKDDDPEVEPRGAKSTAERLHLPGSPCWVEPDVARDQTLQNSQQYVAELQAAMGARDEHECVRIRAYEQDMQDQAAEKELNRSERKKWKSYKVDQEIEESRRKEGADAEIASFQAKMFQVRLLQAQDSEAAYRATEARVAQERANSQREAEAIAREAEKLGRPQRPMPVLQTIGPNVSCNSSSKRLGPGKRCTLSDARQKKPSCRVSKPKWLQAPLAANRETHLLYPMGEGGRTRRYNLVLAAEEPHHG
jgi:hypothetical protein